MYKTKKEITIFFSRLFGFLVFAGVLPFLFIAYRFEMFSGSKAAMGWGIFGYVILGLCLKYILSEVADAAPWTMWGQCVRGFMRIVVPLLLVYGILVCVKSSIDYLLQATACTLLCECVAIPLNPLPKWRHDFGIEEEDRRLGKFMKGLKEAIGGK